jgi:carbon starvation protein
MGVTDPLGGINTLFPLFGIANQLLAAIALTVATVVVVKKGLLKWAWIPGLPLLWDALVTLTASWQKIFSADPKIGYFTQHSQYLAARGHASFGSAKSPEQIEAVIRNTLIQGTLSVVFAVLVLTVLLVGVVAAIQAARGDGRQLTDDQPVPSRRFAPRGLVPTAAEKEVQRQWDALPS